MDATVEPDLQAHAAELGPRWIRPTAFAKMTGLARRTVYEHLYSGKLRGVQIGETWYIEASEINDFFEREGRRVAA